MAFRAICLLASVNQRFEGMITVLADVFENRHRATPLDQLQYHLRSKGGKAANQITRILRPPWDGRRARPNAGEFFPATANRVTCSGRAKGRGGARSEGPVSLPLAECAKGCVDDHHRARAGRLERLAVHGGDRAKRY